MCMQPELRTQTSPVDKCILKVALAVQAMKTSVPAHVEPGARLLTLPVKQLIGNRGRQKLVDLGTVEEVYKDEGGNGRFWVLWDRTGIKTSESMSSWKSKFEIIGTDVTEAVLELVPDPSRHNRDAVFNSLTLEYDASHSAECCSAERTLQTLPDVVKAVEFQGATPSCGFALGQQVECRNAGNVWIVGTITSTFPLKAKRVGDWFPHTWDEVRPLAPCASRKPVVGDLVASMDGRVRLCSDVHGNESSWKLLPEESATVVEVDDDGDFRCSPSS